MTRTAIRILLTGIVALVLAFATAQTAVAQNPYTNVRVSMSEGPSEIGPGQAAQVPVTVSFAAANFTCSQQANFVVKLSVSGADEPAAGGSTGGNASGGANGTTGAAPAAGPALTAQMEPTELNFSYPQGLHHDVSGNGAQGESQDATLSLMGGSSAAGTNATIEVTGTFDDAPQGCQGASGFPEASGSASHTVTVFPDPDAADANATANGTGLGGDDNATAGNETDGGGAPNLGSALVLGTVALVALAMARRRTR